MSRPVVSTIFLAILIFIHDGIATSTFKPNCTLPPQETNYVSSPNTRGTLSILWSCLSIIILCTWNILHLNIPARRQYTESTIEKLWWSLLDSRTKVKWMIVTILVPEYLAGKALNDRLAARDPPDGWETIHAYYANMGGLALDFTDVPFQNQDPPQAISGNRMPDTQAGDRRMPSEEVTTYLEELVDSLQRHRRNPSKTVNLARMKHRTWALNARQWDYAWSGPGRLIEGPPREWLPSRADIEALDKGDFLTKAIAILQISWLAVELIARKVAQLPSSQLEISTLAFSVSSIITYALYLDRPQGVTKVTKIKALRLPDENICEKLLSVGQSNLWQGKRRERKTTGELDMLPIPNDASTIVRLPPTLNNLVDRNVEMLSLTFGAVFGGTIFGAFHCLAWNFVFPTSTEKLLWRTASILTTGLPAISIPFMFAWMRASAREKDTPEDERKRVLLRPVLQTLISIYLIARVFILVETIRSLLFLPPEAFVSSWTGAFPHWG